MPRQDHAFGNLLYNSVLNNNNYDLRKYFVRYVLVAMHRLDTLHGRQYGRLYYMQNACMIESN